MIKIRPKNQELSVSTNNEKKRAKSATEMSNALTHGNLAQATQKAKEVNNSYRKNTVGGVVPPGKDHYNNEKIVRGLKKKLREGK